MTFLASCVWRGSLRVHSNMHLSTSPQLYRQTNVLASKSSLQIFSTSWWCGRQLPRFSIYSSPWLAAKTSGYAGGGKEGAGIQKHPLWLTFLSRLPDPWPTACIALLGQYVFVSTAGLGKLYLIDLKDTKVGREALGVGAHQKSLTTTACRDQLLRLT